MRPTRPIFHSRSLARAAALAVFATTIGSALASDLEQPSRAPLPQTVLQPTKPLRNDSTLLSFFRDAEWYFSWGYSKEWWAPTDIHVSQPALGNDFTLYGVRGHDEAGIPSSASLTGPQYNIRIGRFIDSERKIAIELNFDHTKYTSTTDQLARVSGLIGGVQTNGTFKLDDNFFKYLLHNGANHLMMNVVYRQPLIGQTNETLSVAAIGKIGAGVMLPHTQDTILGNMSDVGQKTWGNLIGLRSGWWQLNGVTAGAEAGLRIVLYKPVYLEVTDKVAYAYLTNIPAFAGTMRHSLWMNEVIVSLGVTYDGVALFGGR